MKSCEKHGYSFSDNATCLKCDRENKHFTVSNTGGGSSGPDSRLGGGSSNSGNGASSIITMRTNSGCCGSGKHTPVYRDKVEEKRNHRNDLAKEAMKIVMQFRSERVGSGKCKEVAINAYAYADAMLAASGDYDES